MRYISLVACVALVGCSAATQERLVSTVEAKCERWLPTLRVAAKIPRVRDYAELPLEFCKRHADKAVTPEIEAQFDALVEAVRDRL